MKKWRQCTMGNGSTWMTANAFRKASPSSSASANRATNDLSERYEVASPPPHSHKTADALTKFSLDVIKPPQPTILISRPGAKGCRITRQKVFGLRCCVGIKSIFRLIFAVRLTERAHVVGFYGVVHQYQRLHYYFFALDRLL